MPKRLVVNAAKITSSAFNQFLDGSLLSENAVFISPVNVDIIGESFLPSDLISLEMHLARRTYDSVVIVHDWNAGILASIKHELKRMSSQYNVLICLVNYK